MINILPYSQKKSIERLRMLRVATVTIWVLAFLSGVAILLLIPLLVTINARFAIAGGQIEALERAGVVARPVDVAILQARTERLAAKLAAPLPVPPVDYIAIVRSVPAFGIALTGFTLETRESPLLEIAGTAQSREALQRFIAVLEQHEKIASVESPVSNYVKSVNSTFKISIAFK